MKTDLRDGRKKHLVTSAQKTFARKGFFSAGIAEIVHEAGIARGTFYQYFDHKLHIFETILDSFLQNLQECIRPIAVGAGAPSPVSQIHDNLSRVLQLVLRARELTHILLRHGSTEDHAVDDQLKDFFRRVAEMIERSLKVGISMNLVRPCNTRLTAYSMIGAVKEVAFEITSSNEAEPPVEEVVRDLTGIPQIKPTFLDIAPSGIPSNIIPHSKGVKCGLIRSNSPFSYSNHRPAKPKIPKPLVYAQVSPLGTSFATP